MSIECKYSPVEENVTIENKFEIEEETIIEESKSESARLKPERKVSVANGSSKIFLYIAACIANLVVLTVGITLGWTASELPKLENNSTTTLPVPVTITQSAWIGSLLPLGAAIGPLAAGISADQIGRKNTLLVAGVPFIIAFVGFAWAKHILIFYLLRFICGLCTGFIYTVLPMYIGEISDDSVRGALGSFMQLFLMTGLLYAYSIGPYVTVMIFNLICIIPPILFLILFFIFIPESPYFLLTINKDEEAAKALSKFRSNSNVEKELESIRQALEETKANKASFLDLFKSKVNMRATIISIGLIFFQQFTGINIVLFYTYEVTGGSIRSDIATILVGVMQVMCSFITPIFVERRGKRFLLLFSAIGMVLALSGLGYYFRMGDIGSSTDSISWLPMLSLVIYNISYCSGFGPLPWAILAELFPGNVKAAASTLTAFVCWFLGFLTTRYFSIVVEVVGKGISFFIFSTCCIFAGLFVYKLVPETSGKSFHEIQDILAGKDSKSNAIV